jgi:hypothetical protein
MNVNRLEQTVVRTSGLTASWEQCGDADNIRLKEILKRRALFGNQTVVLLTSSGALTNSGASNPFFVIGHFKKTQHRQTLKVNNNEQTAIFLKTQSATSDIYDGYDCG